MYTKDNNCDFHALWEDFNKTKSGESRNRLVTAYSYLVSCIGAKMRSLCVNGIDLDDIVSQGFLALIDSVERFDGERGVKFESFASIRIRGAMIDYVRKQDIIPRRVRKAGRDIDSAHSAFWAEHNREPTQEELASCLSITVEELRKTSAEVFRSNMLYFDEILLNQEYAGDSEEQSSDLMPEAETLRKELHNTLTQAIESLTEKEKTVIGLYYQEQLKLKEIAYVLEVSESRVCQIHSAAIGKMQKYMKKNYEI